MNVIDLRSDTVTQPTKGMKEAMMSAKLGDDVLGDDPTVIALQEKVADILGHEAGLFVPSGTMANQIAIRTHSEPGDEIIIHEKAHVFLFETGALGGICGVQTRMLPGDRGILDPVQIKGAIRGSDHHYPPTKLVCLENTHNQGGGTIYPLDRVKEISELTGERKLGLHMDGARLWNAAIASGHPPSSYAKLCDSVSVCLSKGLGAPAGSVLVGSKKFIARATRFRKMFGGAMRQSGMLAAAGIYALDHQYERLSQDHDNAKYFAQNIQNMDRSMIDVEGTETNLVYFGFEGIDPHKLERKLRDRRVYLFAERPGQVRAVMHLGISREHVEETLTIIQEVSKEK